MLGPDGCSTLGNALRQLILVLAVGKHDTLALTSDGALWCTECHLGMIV
jgi:hypothetical protein